MSVVLLNVDELWLKGKNRARYQQHLQNQIRQICKYFHSAPFSLKNQNQRLILNSSEEFSPALLCALKNLPGLFALQPARSCPSALTDIEQCACTEMENQLQQNPECRTFRVSTHRSFKDFPLGSMEVDRQVGAKILSQFPALKVDLKKPGTNLEIKIASENHSYVTAQKIEGVGGLPVGSSGKLVTLLSGGFDSPVASYLMSARGCQQIFAFFHAYPFVGNEVKSKILDLGKILVRHQMGSQLFVIPFGKIQNLIAQNCQERYRTLLFRYAMLMASDLLAEQNSCDALCTGDSLSQVSSQTLENLTLLDGAGQRPILRPLVGLSKREIINWAKQIGTHDLSVIPHDDACSLFAPKRPVIRPKLTYWNSVTQKLLEQQELKGHLSRALVNSEQYSLHFSGRVTPVSTPTSDKINHD